MKMCDLSLTFAAGGKGGGSDDAWERKFLQEHACQKMKVKNTNQKADAQSPFS